jgi:hypothetical protein
VVCPNWSLHIPVHTHLHLYSHVHTPAQSSYWGGETEREGVEGRGGGGSGREGGREGGRDLVYAKFVEDVTN